MRGRNGSRVAAFSFDHASAMAEQLEAAGHEALDFSCTIMVIGETCIDRDKEGLGCYWDYAGNYGVVINTHRLLPCWEDQCQNEKILHSVKRFIRKTPPDIVLYLDRLVIQSRDYGDMPLLRTIAEVFRPSIWFNAIVILTHTASAPLEGSNGTATSYDMFGTQRSMLFNKQYDRQLEICAL
ncbi:hypothetical protein K7X08_004392 [Anisodus acutangulus]|uniref:AIG1-type G domain-containing protein n=1 Tax=Anisodus acutangulus TaxID=402998 RepID=A0A9Q1ML25_9SOLA|nr:hypothetical protein K7X08_004392 [Anisodus acutangulus]